MQIEFLAHASFLFTDSDGHRFMIDPYESGGFSGRVGYDPIDVAPGVGGDPRETLEEVEE